MTSVITIYNSYGAELVTVTVSTDSYRRWQVMGEHAVTLNFQHAGFLEVPVGSYITYKGQRYTLYNPSNFTKNANRNYDYTLRLEAYQATMADSIFINIPDGRTSFSRTARPQEFLKSLVDNLNRNDIGWTVGLYIDAAPKTIQFNETNCSEALRLMAEAFNTEWEVNGKTISLRKVEYNKDAPLALQYGNGFKCKDENSSAELGRINFDNSRPISRLFVRGGERNIDYSTYGSQTLLLPELGQSLAYDGTHFQDEEGFNSSIARAYIVWDSTRRLMGPLISKTESRREGSVELTEIYPMREGAVTGVLWYYKEVEHTSYSSALSAAQADGADGGSVFCDFFDNTIPASLDYSQHRLNGEQMTVVFQTGMLAGREFAVQQEENTVSGYVHVDPSDPAKNRRFKLVTEFVDGFPMPGGNFSPVVGDKYAVFGMKMPQEYIGDNATKSGASWDLFREAVKYLYLNEDYRFTFKGELDGIWAQRNWDAVEDKIVAGGHVLFSDPQFQPDGVLIRISAIKEYLIQPYKPIIELTNVVIGGGLRGELAEIPQQEVVIDEQAREIRQLKSRRWRDTEETKINIDELYAAMGEALSASSLSTMYVRVGNEMGQFRFVTSRTSNITSQTAPTIDYDPLTNRIRISGGTTGATAYIQHQTLGIDDLDGKSPTGGNGTTIRPASEYKSWSLPSALSDVLEKDKHYWIYARVSKTTTTGTFLVEATARTAFEDSNFYYLVVGSLNSEREGERSFFPLYGFAELGPGQLTIGLIRSADGNTWLNLNTGDFHIGNDTTYLDWNAISAALTLHNAGLVIGDRIALNPDGSGLLAGGKIYWDVEGNLYVDTAIIKNSKLTDVEVSGILQGVTGSFKSLNCVDNNGNIVGGISFGQDGKMWIDGDLFQQSDHFYANNIFCRGTFGAQSRNTMVVYGTYGFYYPDGLGVSATKVRVDFASDTAGGRTYYRIPLSSGILG
jgi:predicted small secreted protein